MTPSIKQLIRDRQKAFHSGNVQQWHTLRSKVQSEIHHRKRTFYNTKFKSLKKEDCCKWWKTVNHMSSGSEKSNSTFTLERNGQPLSQVDLVNTLNDFFVSVSADIPQLNLDELPAFLPALDQAPTVQPFQVCQKFLALKPFKASVADNIPPRVLKQLAYELAEPVTKIFNVSLKSGVVPSIWKDPNITPVPKIHPPTDEGDIRPISLTPCISKVLEDFVIKWMISDIRDKIDPRQFGCLKGKSTTYCLLDLVHNWLSHLDSPGQYLRICFLDFSKAFDHINHNVLINKLIELGVRRSLIPWIINFLANRRQCVRLGELTSNWMPITAGVPQGTKLGPILFLVMVNDLKTHQNVDNWKFVDNISMAEALSRDVIPAIQSNLESTAIWTNYNWMKLNASKCKKMLICFLRKRPEIQPLCVNGKVLETVKSHKVLGLIIQDNLKWNKHIKMSTSKALKRFHIIRVLQRGGVPPHDLLHIYYALVRSVSEYCCVIWHNSLPKYLSKNIEMVQKRALHIILPGTSYSEALAKLNCPRLDDRRTFLCPKTIRNIASGSYLSRHYSRQEKVRANMISGKSLITQPLIAEQIDFKKSFFPSLIPSLNL